MFEEVQRRGLEVRPTSSRSIPAMAAPAPHRCHSWTISVFSIRESLPIVDNLRKLHGLKERVRLVASGKFVTPAGVAWALCVGADFVDLGARLHVRARLHPGAELQQEHVPDGRHDAQRAAAART